MTPVERYFKSEGTNASKLATLVGVHPSYLYRMISGERDSSPDLARKVEAETGGKLSALDFLSTCMEARKRRRMACEDQSHIRGDEASSAGEQA